MAKKNWDNIFGVFRSIIAEPKTWDQTSFIIPNDKSPCGTSMCFAGHALNNDPAYTIETNWDYNTFDFKLTGGRHVAIEDAAQKSLGLDDDEADALFYRTLDDPPGEHAYVDRWPEERRRRYYWGNIMELIETWAEADGVEIPEDIALAKAPV